MPVRPVQSEDRPTYITKPDIRFATTVLSHEFRDYAVEDEMMMDKMTGEIFIKRPSDGRVLSYEQNKKYLYDLMLELRILLTNNTKFTYNKESPYGCYISTNYDLNTINKDILNNILENETEIHLEDDEGYDLNNTLSFPVSSKSNGFFCRPTTRDSDKLIVNVLTTLYDKTVKDYAGDIAVIKEESKKFNMIENWDDMDVVIHYNLKIENNGSTKIYEDNKDYLRFNEETCVLFPSTIMENYPDFYDKCTVIVTKIEYPKIRFLKSLTEEELGVNLDDVLNQYGCLDKNIFVNYFNVVSFLDNYSHIRFLGNEVIVGCINNIYVQRYMSKMAKLKNSSEFIQSIIRPSDDDWGANTVWAEVVRDGYQDDRTIYRNSETDIKELETLLANKSYAGPEYVNINPDPQVLKDLYLELLEGGL